MIKVKTFATPIKMFAAHRELEELDEQVSAFLNDQKAVAVYSVGDTTTVGQCPAPADHGVATTALDGLTNASPSVSPIKSEIIDATCRRDVNR